MSSNISLPSSSLVPSIKVSDFASMNIEDDDEKVTKEQEPAKGTKYRDLSTEQKFQYRFAIPPPPDKRLLTQASLKIKVGDYSWIVHEDFIWSESTYIRDSFKAGSNDNSIDLSEHKPELIARMILFCYYEAYPISPDILVVPTAKSVAQVMSEKRTSEASSSDTLAEPKFDCVLHLQMYTLSQELGMKYLTAYGQKKFRKALATEAEGFWPCVELLNNVKDDEIADKVERRLRHAIDTRVWSTRQPFKDLEKLNPGMALRISDLGKSRFGQR